MYVALCKPVHYMYVCCMYAWVACEYVRVWPVCKHSVTAKFAGIILRFAGPTFRLKGFKTPPY